MAGSTRAAITRLGGAELSNGVPAAVACVDRVFSVQSCSLYRNEKDAPEFLFVAAAALFSLTGDAAYRADADRMWNDVWAQYQVFLYNWNNVVTQGLVIMSMSPDAPGAQRSRDTYLGFLSNPVRLWTDCSNNGQANMKKKVFCKCAPHSVHLEDRHAPPVPAERACMPSMR